MKKLLALTVVLILVTTTLTGCIGVMLDLFSNQGRTATSKTTAVTSSASTTAAGTTAADQTTAGTTSAADTSEAATTTITTEAESDAAVYELVWNGKAMEHQAIDNLKTYLADSKIPVLVDFWAVWCGPCTASAPAIENLAKTYVGKVHFVKVNTDFAGDIANDFNVTGIPHFVVIKDGKQVDSVTGYSEELEAILGGKLDAALG